MFRHLRNRFIITNLIITAIIVVVSFAIIYFSLTKNVHQRPFIPEDAPVYTTDVKNIIINSITVERTKTSNDLLIILFISGISIEILVAIISYFLAEESIKPVKEAYESQKIFIANASHEIKTPLAAISANLEAADLHENKWIKNIEFETQKLATLNGELLNLARIDLVSEPSKAQDANLQKIIENELKSAQPRINSKKLEYSKNLKKIITKISPKDFREIISILLDNAIKYSKKQIEIILSEHEFIIKNDGKLISKSDQEHIFERFYQADKSSEGVGLGLSIAKSLAEHNHWQLCMKTDQNLNIFTLKF